MDGEEKKIILSDSDEAASVQTVTGWVSRDGLFFGKDERAARYAGSTHRKCDKCGTVIDKNSYCRDCHAKGEIAKYDKMERRGWNGSDALYSQAVDQYFFSADELDQYCKDEETVPENLRLIICVPATAGVVNPRDIYESDLAEDGEIPLEVQDAFDELNARLTENKTILSWFPGKYAALLTQNNHVTLTREGGRGMGIIPKICTHCGQAVGVGASYDNLWKRFLILKSAMVRCNTSLNIFDVKNISDKALKETK
jgi:hypothetical protein